MVALNLFFAVITLAVCASARWIVPGARWYDTDGNLINAHAGGLCVDQKTGRFYWFGEYKVEGHVEGGGISVYSSDDLATWTSHGLALAPVENHTYISPDGNRIQRPKVIYSEGTGQYHMWWHADDNSYSWLLQGLATSDNIAGPYTFVSATSPLGNCVEVGDVYVSRFNKNLTAVEEVTYRFPHYDFEAPTIIQTEKSYCALMSHKTGYRPNRVNVVALRADKLEGPWSQPFFGTKMTTYLYMADQWDLNSLWESRNVWLPMEIDEREGNLRVVWHDVYYLNVKTGEWKPIKGKTYFSADAKTSGNAYLQEATFASRNRIATGIYGNDSTATFTVQGQGQDQWVSFYHQNIDDMGFGDQPMGQPDRINGTWQLRRIGSIVVNGDTDNVHTLYQKDTHKGIILSTPLLLPLKKGANTITVGGLYNGFDYKGAVLDRIVLYPPENEKRGRSLFGRG
ncbi:glycosyl hydrolase [Aspergillus desertorum]